MAGEAAVAATNWWNPIGWLAAGILVVEVIIVVGAAAYYYADDISIDLKSNQAGNARKTSTSTSSSPATPPNNRNNKNDNDKQRNGTPRNNRAQNKQARDAANKAGLSQYQRRLFHEEITGQNLSYQELLECAYEIKGLYCK